MIVGVLVGAVRRCSRCVKGGVSSYRDGVIEWMFRVC